MRYTITEGNYAKMGTTVTEQGTYFTFEGDKDASCAILLYHDRTGECSRIEVPREYCIGALRSVFVSRLDIRHYQYNYEIDGVEIVDPYAVRITGREKWADIRRAEGFVNIRGGFSKDVFDWEGDQPPELAAEDMVMYKLHVRGFTMDSDVKGRKKGTFAGVMEKIPYLKELGVTTVELMPIYEFEELVIPKKMVLPDYLKGRDEVQRNESRLQSEQKMPCKLNYWGYLQGNYFAPKASYGAGKDVVVECKELVKAFHKEGIECILEFYFDEKMNQNRMIDVLRYWVMEYHVDGFHLLGASMPIKAMVQDLVLRRTKLFYTEFSSEFFAENTDYPHLFVYKEEYLYPLRKLLNHIDANLGEFVQQQRKQNKNVKFVNYAALNNNFTLSDVFMYNEKHNQDNGENNTDGMDWNFCSNYGVEGPSRKKYIKAIRGKQVRNALAMVLLSQGVPLLASGDEFANTQKGNNNAYCQDNKIGWINWKEYKSHQSQVEYVKGLLEFRRKHPILRNSRPMYMHDHVGSGYPDLSYHCEKAWVMSFEPSRQAVGMMYVDAKENEQGAVASDFIYVAYNFHNGMKFLALPNLPKNMRWELVMDTALEQPFEVKAELLKQDTLEIPGLSIRILVAR